MEELGLKAKEKEIQFGKGGRWQDIEADDEATVDKMMNVLLIGNNGPALLPRVARSPWS